MEKQQPQDNRASTVLGRRLGGELLALRTAAGLNQGQAAKALTASTGKIAKMESGWVPMRDPDIRALCELYGAHDPATVGGLLELARLDRERRKSKGWWDDFPGLGYMNEYVRLEHAAVAIRCWQLVRIPGLLQTPDYVRALKDDDAFVAARLARQQRLDSAPPLSLEVVLHEAALRHLVGDRNIMRAQLDHLTAAVERPHVSLRVLSFSAGAMPGLDSAFNVLSFAEPGAMDIVYLDGLFSGRWAEGGKEAVQHVALFERIAGRALSPQDSLALINDIRDEL
ncbi:XRE family transcriptional regulator [Streptomyces sp. 8K308]|uniref:helix-turn-helix domain-containing protein n=1 Tax=Streptomyces sp. 8K308 TaxID=2530388 RepID=UPI001051E702|nr:helix-turn-helix transcriptional regulator [Streptomyces sp. 8K308]TDC21406.1 XRE family transcriptional regulator [Streptomyces sp. 8K308]